MVTAILTARAILNVPTHEALCRKVDKAMVALRARGYEIAVHDAEEPLAAMVNHGRWIGLCTCQAGVAIEPGWPDARCSDCGAVYQDVIWPIEREAIEAVLLARPRVEHRNWHPSETLDMVRAENSAHGLGG